jgi:hypothetical protein
VEIKHQQRHRHGKNAVTNRCQTLDTLTRNLVIGSVGCRRLRLVHTVTQSYAARAQMPIYFALEFDFKPANFEDIVSKTLDEWFYLSIKSFAACVRQRQHT